MNRPEGALECPLRLERE